MKLSLTTTWNTAGLLLLQATLALAASQAPPFESCSPVEQDFLEPAIPDAFHSAEASLTTINAALSPPTKDDVLAATVFNRSAALAFVERWFGRDALPGIDFRMANLEYLHEFFTRMHDKIGESSTTYRCLKSNTWCDERFHGAFTMIQGDDDNHTIWMNPSLDGINFCPMLFDPRNAFRSTWNETVKL